MEYKLRHLDQFIVAGLSVRTINKDGKSEKDIGDLWTRFTTGNISDQIPGKLSEDSYCVYTDYESDQFGWYTAVLGCSVKGGDALPHGIVATKVPSGNYRVYQPLGEFPANVASTWRSIWQDDIDRAYRADFDLYKAGASSFEETEAEVYLGVV